MFKFFGGKPGFLIYVLPKVVGKYFDIFSKLLRIVVA